MTEEKEIFDKEIFDIVTETRIKVLKERNPDYEEVLTILEKFSHNEIIETLRKENEQLKEQIGKMKNVGNCKHSMTCAEWNEKQSYLGLMKFCLNCKDWELAE